jgi:4-carboxymuconolactone decarboxylase
MPEGKPPLTETIRPAVPDLIDITNDFLFGQIWKRPGIRPRDRSLITITILIATNRWEPLPEHLELGRKNGLSDEEISEFITHAAFYAGWPSAMSAAHIALDTLKLDLRGTGGAR